MKIDAALIQACAAFLAALAAVMGAMYAVITRPLLKRMDDIELQIAIMRGNVVKRLDSIDVDLRAIHAELKTQGERLTRVEERLPPPRQTAVEAGG